MSQLSKHIEMTEKLQIHRTDDWLERMGIARPERRDENYANGPDATLALLLTGCLLPFTIIVIVLTTGCIVNIYLKLKAALQQINW